MNDELPKLPPLGKNNPEEPGVRSEDEESLPELKLPAADEIKKDAPAPKMSLMDAIAQKQALEPKSDEKIKKQNEYIDGEELEIVPLTNSDKGKVFAIGGIASLVVVSAVTLAMNLGGSEKIVTPPTDSSTTSSNSSSTNSGPWYAAGGAVTSPEALDTWETTSTEISFTDLSSEEIKALPALVKDTNLGDYAHLELPSETLGYTSDPTKEFVKGSPNPAYVFLTEDDFLLQSTLAAEKLMNPLYGGWGKYQYASSNAKKSFDPGELVSLFSFDYVKKNLGKTGASAWPVFADWNSNNYGMEDSLVPAGDARWFGTIDSAQADFQYDKKLRDQRINTTYNITFKAYNLEKQVITKKGVLKLSFIPNYASKEDTSLPKILIDKASLEIK